MRQQRLSCCWTMSINDEFYQVVIDDGEEKLNFTDLNFETTLKVIIVEINSFKRFRMNHSE